MSALASEVMAARQQHRKAPDGRAIDTTATCRQRDAAMLEFSARDLSPYYTKAKENTTQNRLRDIAQGKKAKAAGLDSARKTKPEAAAIAGGGHGSSGHYSGHDADDDSGYATCRQE
jgi:hypothetical protein